MEDLSRRSGFAWRLRVLMALADIRAGELSAESGICMKTIYNIRAGNHKPDLPVREKLLTTIEEWRPGTLGMMRAAEKRGLRH